jgi:hypothetical protein
MKEFIVAGPLLKYNNLNEAALVEV